MPTKKHVSRSRGVSRLFAHLVLTTKYRKKIITPEMLTCLEQVIGEVIAKWQCELVEFNGEPEHVHILFRFYPQVPLDNFIGNVKSVSSRKIRQQFPEYLSKIYHKPVFWNESYSIDSCGAAPLQILVEYIKDQAGCDGQSPQNSD